VKERAAKAAAVKAAADAAKAAFRPNIKVGRCSLTPGFRS